MMNIPCFVDIIIEMVRIDNGYFLKEEFIELICMNLTMMLYIILSI